MSRRVRDLALGIALLGLPALALWAQLKQPNRGNVIDRVLVGLSAPIQAGVTSAVGAVHSVWKKYVYLVGLHETNARLRRENGELRRQVSEANRKLRRLDSYKRLLDFRKERQVDGIGVRVIARATSSLTRVVRVQVDRGSEVLGPGWAVVTADGVLGRVGRVYGGYADVILASDADSSIDVLIPRVEARGLLKGTGRDGRRCRLDYLLKDAKVRIGDAVVTSGAGGVFPQGVKVGRVSKMTDRVAGLYREAEVKLAVDAAQVREGLAVSALPPPPAWGADGVVGTARGWSP